MAYDAGELSVVACVNGFTLWHYRTPDKIGDVLQAGYFDRATKLQLPPGAEIPGAPRLGDFMFVNAGNASCTLVVTTNSNGCIEVRVSGCVPMRGVG